jgi:hypothetical protein
LRDGIVLAVGITSDVDQARDGRRVGADFPGSQMNSRAHYGCAIDIAKSSQGFTFVVHAVLETNNREVEIRRRRDLFQYHHRVLALHGEKDDVILRKLNFSGAGYDPEFDNHGARRACEAKARLCYFGGMGPPRDSDDVMTRLDQTSTDDAANRTDADYDESHLSVASTQLRSLGTFATCSIR